MERAARGKAAGLLQVASAQPALIAEELRKLHPNCRAARPFWQPADHLDKMSIWPKRRALRRSGGISLWSQNRHSSHALLGAAIGAGLDPPHLGLHQRASRNG